MDAEIIILPMVVSLPKYIKLAVGRPFINLEYFLLERDLLFNKGILLLELTIFFIRTDICTKKLYYVNLL